MSSARYHGSEPLTYSCAAKLDAGAIVSVELGSQEVVGVVLRTVEQPDFKTKLITKQVHERALPESLISLDTWMQAYYPGPAGMRAQLLLPSSLLVTRKTSPRKPAIMPINDTMTPLRTEQAAVLAEISKHTGPFLLHGETGSGKTRVYIESVKQCLAKGRSAVVLTPEIGLIPQLANSFIEIFGHRVIIVHSEQTAATRRNQWLAIHESSQPIVVIGPRSALFSPVSNLGLIIVDEAHDTAYKQEQMPYYQTTRVAAQLAKITNAKLLLGTATPLVQDYYFFEKKQLPILRMEKPANHAVSTVETTVVNLTDRQNFSRSPWLSTQLLEAISHAMQQGVQSLIFLNRRGTARLVLCQTCGWQALCPRCDLPLTYHADSHGLRCHTCGYTNKTPSSCPECSSVDIVYKSVGTKTIATELSRLFPSAKIQRFDGDTKQSDNLASQYQSINTGQVDILVGTQMISKGLDLPLLGVVGVINADTGLVFPDYTANERTFQLLRQVIGRVGRNKLQGTVIVQTYQPNHPSIQAAVSKKYADFYTKELSERELYKFPPFYFMLKLSVVRSQRQAAIAGAQKIVDVILGSGLSVSIVGPTPAFSEKARGKFCWQIIVRAKQRRELISIVQLLPKSTLYDIDPNHLL